MTRILVTGAAGFLGFHLARALAQDSENTVICVDNFVRGERDAHYETLTAQKNVERFDIDLCDAAQINALPDDVDFVYHLAALNGTQNFYEQPFEVVRCCTLPTMALLAKYGPSRRLSRFVYAGTSESYASTVTRFNWPVPTAENVPLSIDDIENPRWSYAASKMHGEIATVQAARAFGLAYTIIRYHNAYGPRMGDKHVIPDFLARARNGEFALYGHSDTRSFIYVDDAVAASISVGQSENCKNQVVNIGGSQEIDMLTLAKRIMAVNGMQGDIALHASPKGSVSRRAPDLAKLKAMTGFTERWALDDGLVATSRFYLNDELIAPSLNPAVKQVERK